MHVVNGCEPGCGWRVSVSAIGVCECCLLICGLCACVCRLWRCWCVRAYL
jgi:hypothetical protein